MEIWVLNSKYTSTSKLQNMNIEILLHFHVKMLEASLVFYPWQCVVKQCRMTSHLTESRSRFKINQLLIVLRIRLLNCEPYSIRAQHSASHSWQLVWYPLSMTRSSLSSVKVAWALRRSRIFILSAVIRSSRNIECRQIPPAVSQEYCGFEMHLIRSYHV